jgi:hypothetical protein
VKASHAACATAFEEAKDHSIALPAVSIARSLAEFSDRPEGILWKQVAAEAAQYPYGLPRTSVSPAGQAVPMVYHQNL